VHHSTQARLHEKFGLKIVRPMVRTSKVDSPAAHPVRVLPQKLVDLLEKIDAGGFDIVGKLMNKLNPFNISEPFLAVACAMLLQTKSSVTVDQIAGLCAKKIGCTPAVAKENVIYAVYVLAHAGATKNIDGQISLKGI
jgi:hypothetical protein